MHKGGPKKDAQAIVNTLKISCGPKSGMANDSSVWVYVPREDIQITSSRAIFQERNRREMCCIRTGLWHFIISSISAWEFLFYSVCEVFLKQCSVISGSNIHTVLYFSSNCKRLYSYSFNILDSIKNSLWILHKWELVQRTSRIGINSAENFQPHPHCFSNSWCCVPSFLCPFCLFRKDEFFKSR